MSALERSAGARRISLGGVPALQVGHGVGPVVVLLHGFAMTASDLAPFAPRRPEATYLFPDGGSVVPAGTFEAERPKRAWWTVDLEARAAALRFGARDLSDQDPEGVAAARRRVSRVIAAAERRFIGKPVLLGGFSQGAMLAVDWLLHAERDLAGLLVLSGSRIRARHWESVLSRVRGLRVFQSHGRWDRDIGFPAALRLRDVLLQNGARVDWCPFDGGHELAFPVWRGVSRFIRDVSESGAAAPRRRVASGVRETRTCASRRTDWFPNHELACRSFEPPLQPLIRSTQ